MGVVEIQIVSIFAELIRERRTKKWMNEKNSSKFCLFIIVINNIGKFINI
jgi:hypothetical protein